MIVREVRSQAISKIGYNPLTQELHILFNKPGSRYPEYIFGGIDPVLAGRFLTASSHGKFYHSHIKRKTDFTVPKRLGSFRLGAIGRRTANIFRFGAQKVRDTVRNITGF